MGSMAEAWFYEAWSSKKRKWSNNSSFVKGLGGDLSSLKKMMWKPRSFGREKNTAKLLHYHNGVTSLWDFVALHLGSKASTRDSWQTTSNKRANTRTPRGTAFTICLGLTISCKSKWKQHNRWNMMKYYNEKDQENPTKQTCIVNHHIIYM